MLALTVSIDVPDLERGIGFYADAFGFAQVAKPYPGVAVLKAGTATITLLERREQNQAFPECRGGGRMLIAAPGMRPLGSGGITYSSESLLQLH